MVGSRPPGRSSGPARCWSATRTSGPSWTSPRSPESITLALLPHPDPLRWSAVELGPDGQISNFLSPGPRSTVHGPRFLFTGFQLIGERVLAALPRPPFEMKPVWDDLRAAGRLRGVVVAGSWREAGSPAAYLALVQELLGGENYLHDQAEVAQDAAVRSCAVAAGCVVGEGARVSGSVLLSGAVVEPGARVDRCVVAGGRATGELADAVLLPSGRHPLR